MNSAEVTVVTLDHRGIVTGARGGLHHLGLNGDILGRAWSDLFALPQPKLPTDAEGSRTFGATAPSGVPLTVEVVPLPGAPPRPYVLILRPQAGPRYDLQFDHQRFCALGELSANVAHEMNNVLTLILGWLDVLLADSPPASPTRSTLELLVGETERIGRLTRNVLDVARSSGQAPQELDIAPLLDETLCLVRYDMRNSSIALESHIEAGLPRLCASSGRLKQAFLNLLVNARQATAAGGRVTLTARRDGAGHVRVDVADTGCGMSQEVLARIFTPFFTTKRNGTGLGLPVTRRIVEEHGGTLELESRPGAGTRFTVRLPIRAA